MTFNEGMQIDTSTTSTSGGGGGGGRGIAIGGGVGGLVIVLLALFLGVDPGQVVSQQPIPAQSGPGVDISKCKTGADANKYVECRVVATGNSVDGVWSQLLRGYQRPNLRLFTGSVDTACGPATSDVGPFYCPVDKTAYFDTDFFKVLVDQFGSSGGPLAQEYVVAHEYGHLRSRDNLKRIILRICRDLVVLPIGAGLDRRWADSAEQAADEYAANSRRTAALSLASALIKLARITRRQTSLAMFHASFLIHGQGDVTARVRRLRQLQA